MLMAQSIPSSIFISKGMLAGIVDSRFQYINTFLLHNMFVTYPIDIEPITSGGVLYYIIEGPLMIAVFPNVLASFLFSGN